MNSNNQLDAIINKYNDLRNDESTKSDPFLNMLYKILTKHGIKQFDALLTQCVQGKIELDMFHVIFLSEEQIEQAKQLKAKLHTKERVGRKYWKHNRYVEQFVNSQTNNSANNGANNVVHGIDHIRDYESFIGDSIRRAVHKVRNTEYY